MPPAARMLFFRAGLLAPGALCSQNGFLDSQGPQFTGPKRLGEAAPVAVTGAMGLPREAPIFTEPPAGPTQPGNSSPCYTPLGSLILPVGHVR